MVNFGKMIDKLIEISTNQDLSEEVKFQLDEVIDEMIHVEIDNNKQIVPDFNDLSPEEIQDSDYIEILFKNILRDSIAIA